MKTMINLLAVMMLPWFVAASPDTTLMVTRVTGVTLFPEGAQVSREAAYSFHEGSHSVLINGLAEGTDPSTLQVKMGSDLTILSVNFRQIAQPVDTVVFTRQLNDSTERFSQIKRKVSDELWVIRNELLLLNENQVLGGQKRKLTPAEMLEATNFYRSRLKELFIRQTQCEAELRNADQMLSKLHERLKSGPPNNPHKINQVEVLVYCPTKCSGTMLLSYFTTKARWKPIYEVRLESHTGPLRLSRGAKATNTTSEVWENMRLRFVTTNPRLTGDKPVIKPCFITLKDDDRYNTEFDVEINGSEQPDLWKNYSGLRSTLKGKVFDNDTREPIPYANIILEHKGVQLGGATSDFDGNYTISNLIPGAYSVKTSYVGYQPTLLKGFVVSPGRTEFLNIKMVGAATTLDVVEVFDYKVPLIAKDETSSGATIYMDRPASGYTTYDRPDKKKKESGTNSADGEVGTIRGSRVNGQITYIDGIKVIGSNDLPASAIEHVQPDDLSSTVVTSEAINKMPNRSANSVAATVGGTFSQVGGSVNPDGSGFAIKGKRSGYWVQAEKREILIDKSPEAPVTKQYEIDEQLSLPADGLEYRFDLGEETLNVSTEFQIVPCLDRRAFTVAAVPHWDELMLTSGDASLFFADTYIGSTWLDADQFTDTAFISLGAESWLNTSRRVVNELSRNEFTNSNTFISRTIEIVVRNNGHLTVTAQVEDQIPVSTQREIQVELADPGGARYIEKTGSLLWKFPLSAGETRILRFSYSIRHPKEYGVWKL